MVITRTSLDRLTSGNEFIWATGIEDTFIADPSPRTGRILDEYELTGHYERWEEDIDRIAALGVKYARYGIPWYRINPGRNKWDWTFPDRTLGKLLDSGVQPIVDLVHYGTPSWLTGAFTHPDYPQSVADYARRTAERYKGRVFWYTPLNEPRITAWYCGKLGWWPPYQHGWSGFLRVMVGVCKGIALTAKALADVDPEIVRLHVDATDLYLGRDEGTKNVAAQRQEIVFLALDLVSGRVTSEHPIKVWLVKNGVSESDLDWFAENAVELDMIGLNMYPMFTMKELCRRNGRLRSHMPYADKGIVTELCRLYAERYKRPVMIAETASVGKVKRRQAWMRESIAAVREARGDGVPVVGYTWWPMLALVTWAYRQHGIHGLERYILQMGLWDFAKSGSDPLKRMSTPLVEDYTAIVGKDTEEVGALGE